MRGSMRAIRGSIPAPAMRGSMRAIRGSIPAPAIRGSIIGRPGGVGLGVDSVLAAIGTGRENAAGLCVGTRRDGWGRGALAVSTGLFTAIGGVTVTSFTAVALAERPLNEADTTCGPSAFVLPVELGDAAGFCFAATGEIRTGRLSGAAGRISIGFVDGATTESLLTTLST